MAKNMKPTARSCLIDNAGNIGVQGMTPAKNMSVSDGLLDVIVVRDASVGSLLAVGGAVLGRDANPMPSKHWQGREITVVCDPPQTVQGDGEVWDPTPVTAKVLPGVLPILVPPDEQKTKRWTYFMADLTLLRIFHRSPTTCISPPCHEGKHVA